LALDAEAWLKANAIECAKKSARISPQVCRDYQRRDPVNCQGCERLGLSEEQVAATARANGAPGLARIGEMKRKELRVANKVGVCRSCEKTRTLVCRDLCSSCWRKAKEMGTLDELYPVKWSVSELEDEVTNEDLVVVDEGAGDVVVGGAEAGPVSGAEVTAAVKAALDEMRAKGRADGRFVALAREVGRLVEEKQAAYGDSFGRAGEVVRILYPEGIAPGQMDDALAVVRVVDKLFRVATDRDALGESPWRDIAGYGLLGAARVEAGR
jgi:hypothetical protein